MRQLAQVSGLFKQSSDGDEDLPPQRTNETFQISVQRRNFIDLREFLRIPTNASDPCLKGFLRLLQEHLLDRFHGRDFDEDRIYSHDERNELIIRDHRLYPHRRMRLNYTSYDVRLEQDAINTGSHPDIVMLSKDDSSPYWFARVIAIFHTEAIFRGETRKFHLLYVRWFGEDSEHPFRWENRQLPRVGFIPDNHTADTAPFGFVDPLDVVRSVHLIPAFAEGKTDELLGPSQARSESEKDADWNFYYVNMYVFHVSFCLCSS
jgi:hypothetical protein